MSSLNDDQTWPAQHLPGENQTPVQILQAYLEFRPIPFCISKLETLVAGCLLSDRPALEEFMMQHGFWNWNEMIAPLDQICAAWLAKAFFNRDSQLASTVNHYQRIRLGLSDKPRMGIILSGIDDTESQADSSYLLANSDFYGKAMHEFRTHFSHFTLDIAWNVFLMIRTGTTPYEKKMNHGVLLAYFGHGLAPEWAEVSTLPVPEELARLTRRTIDSWESVLNLRVDLPLISSGGDWCLQDGEVFLTFAHIIRIFLESLPQGAENKHLVILSDCCFSGFWVDQLKDLPLDICPRNFITIQSSCGNEEVAKGSCFAPLFALLQKQEWRESMLNQFHSREKDENEIISQSPQIYSTHPSFQAQDSEPVIHLPLQDQTVWFFKSSQFFQYCVQLNHGSTWLYRNSLSHPKALSLTSDQPGLSHGVHTINVGDGDATIIRGRDKLILLDGGNPKPFRERVWPKLCQLLNENQFDQLCLIVTHHDADHIAGIIYLLIDLNRNREYYATLIEKTVLYCNPPPKNIGKYVRNFNHEAQLHRLVDQLKILKRLPIDDPSLQISDPLFSMQAIYPPRDHPEWKAYYGRSDALEKDTTVTNRNSITSANVLSQVWVLTDISKRLFLFTGDAHPNDFGDTFNAIRSTCHDFILFYSDVPHHGSKKNYSPSFYVKFPFQHYVVSTDGHSNLRFPSKNVIDLLRSSCPSSITILGNEWNSRGIDHWTPNDNNACAPVLLLADVKSFYFVTTEGHHPRLNKIR